MDLVFLASFTTATPALAGNGRSANSLVGLDKGHNVRANGSLSCHPRKCNETRGLSLMPALRVSSGTSSPAA